MNEITTERTKYSADCMLNKCKTFKKDIFQKMLIICQQGMNANAAVW